MCPPWIEGAHAGAPLQEDAFLTSLRATGYPTSAAQASRPNYQACAPDAVSYPASPDSSDWYTGRFRVPQSKMRMPPAIKDRVRMISMNDGK